jgi:hypothetical protein
MIQDVKRFPTELQLVTLEEFGFKLPLLIRGTGEIVDGHLRLKAAQKLKMTEVPVMRCDEWSDAQVKAFRLAVNRSATWAVSRVSSAAPFEVINLAPCTATSVSFVSILLKSDRLPGPLAF